MNYAQLAAIALQVMTSTKQVRDLSDDEIRAVLAVRIFLTDVAKGTLVVGAPIAAEIEDGPAQSAR